MLDSEALSHEAHLSWPNEDLNVVGEREGENCKGALLESHSCPPTNALSLMMCESSPIEALAVSPIMWAALLDKSDGVHEIAQMGPYGAQLEPVSDVAELQGRAMKGSVCPFGLDPGEEGILTFSPLLQIVRDEVDDALQ
jgi:hypothetical protein